MGRYASTAKAREGYPDLRERPTLPNISEGISGEVLGLPVGTAGGCWDCYGEGGYPCEDMEATLSWVRGRAGG